MPSRSLVSSVFLNLVALLTFTSALHGPAQDTFRSLTLPGLGKAHGAIRHGGSPK